MTTIGGKPCDVKEDGQRCSKNLGHQSPHRFPIKTPTQGRTLAQTIGNHPTCNKLLEIKGQDGLTTRHRCRKPHGHASNHHDGGRTWA